MRNNSRYPYNVNDIIAIDGKPAIVLGVDNSTNEQILYGRYLRADGSMGPDIGYGVYAGGWKQKTQRIDFAEIDFRVKLPPEWGPNLMPIPDKEESKAGTAYGEPPEYHDSYGVVEVSRPSGDAKLFMSPLRHMHYITLRIRRAVRTRSSSEDGTFGKGLVTEIAMSESQWARMLSSIGNGSGVPCTISYVGGEMMPSCPEYDESAKFHDEVRADIEAGTKALVDAVSKVETLLEKPSVTKADRKEILGLLGAALRELRQNTPFIIQQFDERMDRVVQAGKTEIESYVQTTIQRLGMQQLFKGMPSPVTLELPPAKKREE